MIFLKKNKGGLHSVDFEKEALTSEKTRDSVCIIQLLNELFNEKSALTSSNHHIQLTLDCPVPKPLMMNVDRAAIARVLSNLLNNAVESIDGKGQVTLASRKAKTEVSVAITDTGKGISPEVLTQLTESNVDSVTSTKPGGNGLGLPHAKRTIEAMNGRLEIQSKAGVGTMVLIRLPLL